MMMVFILTRIRQFSMDLNPTRTAVSKGWCRPSAAVQLSDGQRDPFTKVGTWMDFVTGYHIVHPVKPFFHASQVLITRCTQRLFKIIP